METLALLAALAAIAVAALAVPSIRRRGKPPRHGVPGIVRALDETRLSTGT